MLHTIDPVKRLVLGAAILVLVSGCSEQQESDSATAHTTTIHIEVTSDGFIPSQIELTKGEHAQLVFNRVSEVTCADKIHSPELGIEVTELPLNDQVSIDVEPDEPGTYTFACSMDMIEGSAVVTRG